MEAQAFRENATGFAEKNAVILGVSTDSAQDNLAFRRKQAIPFPLLCDVNRDICLSFGACGFRKAYYAERITFVIDEAGLIRRVISGAPAAAHPRLALEAL